VPDGFGEATGNGGAAGVAIAVADANNHTGSADAQAGARGGAGGSAGIGAAGGRAEVEARASSAGNGSAARIGSLDANALFGAWGGAGGDAAALVGARGGDGGDAESDSRASASDDGAVEVEDSARGGDGGIARTGFGPSEIRDGKGGRGGSATCQAEGSNAGSSDVVVEATATGGRGGFAEGIGGSGGAGGIAVATARGASTGGAAVRVSATQIGGAGGFAGVKSAAADGASSVLTDAVTGETSGNLRLEQIAVAGAGGAGALAHSGLSTANALGGEIDVLLRATGGASFFDVLGNGRDGGGATLLGVVSGSAGRAARLTGEAQGGAGGDAVGTGTDGGAGASVFLDEVLSVSGDGELALRQVARGGLGGASSGGNAGAGGAATSHVVKSVASTSLEVSVEALGAVGGAQKSAGPEAGAGGASDASADLVNAGGAVLATARAVGGAGGAGAAGSDGGHGGHAEARVAAETTGDGQTIRIGESRFDSTLGATGGQGGAAKSTPGGSLETAGDGGDAKSQSSAIARGNSSVSVFDRATGGVGGSTAPLSGEAPTDGGHGGSASASATGSNAGSEAVEVLAVAKGGGGGSASGPDRRGGDGGEASLGPVTGSSSEGGRVQVRGQAIGGAGGGGAQGGKGASVSLDDAVTGQTSGELILIQEVHGGGAGRGVLGAAGDASSRLRFETSSSSLELVSWAFGGDWEFSASSSPTPGIAGARADSVVEAVNDRGVARAIGIALGGFAIAGGTGGEAVVQARATTRGDANSVIVGQPEWTFPNSFATGGASGGRGDSSGGKGGRATSFSEGLAEGDSTVSVHDLAHGGDGGANTPFGGYLPGEGGSATSTARGVGAGTSLVDVHARAVAGQGGTRLFGGPPFTRSGDAVASAIAKGLGEVRADASADAYGARFGLSTLAAAPGGVARSDAVATGTSGQASARASSSGGVLSRVETKASASVVGQASVRAIAAPDTSSLDIAGVEDLAAFSKAIAKTVGTSLAAGDDLTDVQIRFSNTLRPEDAVLPLALSSETTMSFALDPRGEAATWLRIGFTSASWVGSGFVSLRLRVLDGEVSHFDTTFEEAAAALAFMDQTTLDFSLPANPFLGLRVLFDLESAHSGDALDVNWSVTASPVPETTTAVLVGFGLACGASYRRRSRRLSTMGAVW
jgi:hypothetical protein